MGRRAKNKQGAPEPLEPKTYPAARKTGKRKADGEHGTTNGRAAKKVKASGVKTSLTAKKSKSLLQKGEPPADSPDEGSGDGWEDVEDGFDTTTKSKYVHHYILRHVAPLNEHHKGLFWCGWGQ